MSFVDTSPVSMTLVSYLKLWAAERSLHRISLELLAARDYQKYTERCYQDEGWSRDDIVSDILDVRHKVDCLEEERLYVLARIAQLKGETVEHNEAR